MAKLNETGKSYKELLQATISAATSLQKETRETLKAKGLIDKEVQASKTKSQENE